MGKRENQKLAFNAPLVEGENENVTIGCRHTNPEIYANAYLDEICAFVRKDGKCMKPVRGWKKKYLELKGRDDKNE